MMGDSKEQRDVERIIPSELTEEEIWQRNGEYVAYQEYEKLQQRIERLEGMLRKAGYDEAQIQAGSPYVEVMGS